MRTVKLSPWLTILVGLATVGALTLLIAWLTGNSLVTLAALFAALGLLFFPYVTIVRHGQEGVLTFGEKRLDWESTATVDGEIFPIRCGLVVTEGPYWLPAMKVISYEVRQITKELAVNALTKDKQSVVVHIVLTMYPKNVHQVLNNKDELNGAIDGICGIAEAEARIAMRSVESTWLFEDEEAKKSQSGKILAALKGREPLYGIDVVSLWATDVDLPATLKGEYEREKRVEIIKRTVPEGQARDDAIAEVYGVEVKRSETKQTNLVGLEGKTLSGITEVLNALVTMVAGRSKR